MKKTIEKKVTAVAYMRTATENARGYNSLNKQEKRIRAYARSQGIKIAAIYADNGYSGLSPVSKLPGLKTIFADAKKKNTNIVIVSGPDRISRNMDLLDKAIKRLESYGAQFKIAKGDLL